RGIQGASVGWRQAAAAPEGAGPIALLSPSLADRASGGNRRTRRTLPDRGGRREALEYGALPHLRPGQRIGGGGGATPGVGAPDPKGKQWWTTKNLPARAPKTSRKRSSTPPTSRTGCAPRWRVTTTRRRPDPEPRSP